MIYDTSVDCAMFKMHSRCIHEMKCCKTERKKGHSQRRIGTRLNDYINSASTTPLKRFYQKQNRPGNVASDDRWIYSTIGAFEFGNRIVDIESKCKSSYPMCS